MYVKQTPARFVVREGTGAQWYIIKYLVTYHNGCTDWWKFENHRHRTCSLFFCFFFPCTFHVCIKLYLCDVKKNISEMQLMHEHVNHFTRCELTYELYIYVYTFASFILLFFIDLSCNNVNLYSCKFIIRRCSVICVFKAVFVWWKLCLFEFPCIYIALLKIWM